MLKRISYILRWGQYSFYKKKFHNITILEDEQTIEYLRKSKASYARFGDGEFKWILMEKQNSFQKATLELSSRLKEVLTSSNKEILIGIPLALKSLKNNNFDSKYYWYGIEKKIAKKILPFLNPKQIYGNASVTRPYMDYIKGDFNARFRNLKKLWENRDLVIIEGEKTKLGVGNDILKNAKSIKRILCPSQNAFDIYDKILEAGKEIPKESLVLLALGPTATVLAYDLGNLGYQAIDIGHIDIEYEWYKKGAKKKVAIRGKAVNEAHDTSLEEESIEDCHYQNSIWKILH